MVPTNLTIYDNFSIEQFPCIKIGMVFHEIRENSDLLVNRVYYILHVKLGVSRLVDEESIGGS